MTATAPAQGTEQRGSSGLPLGTLLRMAWRNLWRQKRRTGLLLLVVAYATLSIVLFWALYDGFFDSAMLGHSRYLGASVLVQTQAYHNDPDPQNALGDLNLMTTLASQPGVKAVAPRLEFPALARSAYASQGVVVRGVDPLRESGVSNIPGRIRQGRMLAAPGEAVLGRKLAQKLDVRLGERLVLNVSGKEGLQAEAVRVVGLVQSGIAPVDQGLLMVSLGQARHLTGVPTATALAIDTPRGQEKAVARRLASLLPAGVQALDVEQQLGALADAMKTKSGSMVFIGLIFSLFAALAVTSTVLVSVLERTREFGMELAVGMRHSQVALMVTLEAMIATVLGWLIGLVIGYGVALFFATHNILGPYFASYGDALQSVGTGDEIYMAVSARYLIYTVLTIAASALFSVLIPARRVGRLNPAEAMRVE